MAEIIGNIGSALEPRTGKESGKEYFTFRVAENSGKGENRKTTWYDVRATIPQLEADLLAAGQAVLIRGRLEPQAYLKRAKLEGVPVPKSWEELARVLKDNEALGSSIVLLTSSVEPYEFKKRDAA